MSQNISIRVNNYPKSDLPDERPEVIVIYHWHRIFSALFLLVLSIVAILYGLNKTWDSSEPVEVEKPVMAETAQAVEKQDEAPVKPQEVQAVSIFSPHIKRAQLTHGLIENEPIDALPSVIHLDAKQATHFYFFMEASGLKKKKIFHDWYWNGKRVERNIILIHHKLQKTASARLIPPSQTGSWMVQAVDEKGKILSKASFEIVLN